jgi:hypothetical protein
MFREIFLVVVDANNDSLPITSNSCKYLTARAQLIVRDSETNTSDNDFPSLRSINRFSNDEDEGKDEEESRDATIGRE